MPSRRAPRPSGPEAPEEPCVAAWKRPSAPSAVPPVLGLLVLRAGRRLQSLSSTSPTRSPDAGCSQPGAGAHTSTRSGGLPPGNTSPTRVGDAPAWACPCRTPRAGSAAGPGTSLGCRDSVVSWCPEARRQRGASSWGSTSCPSATSPAPGDPQGLWSGVWVWVPPAGRLPDPSRALGR